MADDTKKIMRTKADSPKPGAAEAAAKIVFHCSNGHRIAVSAELGGQRGKCSKCGVPVRIPSAGDTHSAAPQPSEGVAEESVAREAAEPGIVPEERFGQSAADGEEARGIAEPTVDMFAGLVDTGDSRPALAELSGFSTPAGFSAQGEHEPQQSDGQEQDAGAFPPVPTADLVARLFAEMEHGGIVEVHVAGGSVILPEFYEVRWSRGSHGLFASRAVDGTVTLTAVAWESVQKIVVRQVEGLPDGMFE